MQTVYTAIQSGMRIREVSHMLGITPADVNKLYYAAQRHTRKNYQERLVKPAKKAVPQPSQIQRPPAQYSNTGYLQLQEAL